ncbi:unnamed protein product, partial [Rotaria magnacalcarata]
SNSNFHCIVILICTHRTNVEQIFKRATVDAVNSPYDSKTAAEIFYVPASTIRRLRGESSLRSHVGRPSYLSNDEELYFVSLLQLLPKYGQSLGLSYRPGVKWLCLFMNRHANDTKWQREGKTERERAEEANNIIADPKSSSIWKSILVKRQFILGTLTNLFKMIPSKLFNEDARLKLADFII